MEYASIALRVFATDLDPKDFSKRIGLEPTDSYSRGERFSKRHELRRESGFWCRSINEVSPAQFSFELTKLLSMLPNTFNETLAAAGARADIFVGLFGIRNQSIFDLEPEALRLLHNYGLTVIFDMYVAEEGDHMTNVTIKTA